MDEETWKESFVQVLDGVERIGSVSTGKALSFAPPKLKVNGLDDEHVAFPLLQRQAIQLRDLAEASPFGKGSQTLVDRSVRKSWEIDASKITVGGSTWSTTLKKVVDDCCDDLGVDPAVKPNVQSHLYKLLLYEKGDFFKPHQDSEKEKGMFGTLTLQLPSLFEGGALVIRHKGEKHVYDCSGQESEETCFCTAFYGDCEHEILPTTSGWRLCLIYNLVVSPATVQPSAALAVGDVEELRHLAEAWSDCCPFDMQGYLLEHDYTETNFDMLKGRDKHVVNLLRAAKDSHGKPLFDVYVLLLEKYDRGQPEYDDPNDMGEIIETKISSYSVHHMDEDDSEDESENEDYTDTIYDAFDPDLHMLNDCEISEEFPDDPERKEYEGYQGNWGPTLEFWFYKGVVVFLPAKRSSSPPHKKARTSSGGADDPITLSD